MGKSETRVVVAGAPEEGGTLTVSEEVLADIAFTEASRTEGVVPLQEPGKKGGRRAPGSVQVQLSGHEVAFTVRIGVRGGMRIPEVAANLRRQIADAVHVKTGFAVLAIHVKVDRVVFEPAQAAQA